MVFIMTKEVLVSIKGLQFEGAMDSEEIETITRGQYYKKNEDHFVIYDELTEGSDVATRNIIKFDESRMNLTKSGLINTHMVFEEHKKSMTNYATSFGDILVGIHTKNIGMQENEEQIMVQVDYSLEINYEYLADCSITMDIRSAEASVFPFSS